MLFKKNIKTNYGFLILYITNLNKLILTNLNRIKKDFKNIASNFKNEYTNHVHKVTSISNEIKSKGFFEWDNFVESHIQKLNEHFERLKEEMKGIKEKYKRKV